MFFKRADLRCVSRKVYDEYKNLARKADWAGLRNVQPCAALLGLATLDDG